jgi:hypothetical protein
MTRGVRMRLLGDGWHGYVPENRIVVIPEGDAAAFLRHRGSARHVEVLGWVDEPEEEEEPKPHEQTP